MHNFIYMGGKKDMKILRKYLVIGLIFLFVGAGFIPNICSFNNISEESESIILEKETIGDNCHCFIIKPVVGLYIDDDLIWEFKIINRPVIFGDITFKVEVFNPPDEIECIYFELWRVGALPIKWDSYSDCNGPPWEWTYKRWNPRGLYLIKVKSYPEFDCEVDELQYWDLG